jgi:hypothetical protein
MGEWKYSSTFLDLGTRWNEWSATRPGRFTPGERSHGTHWIWGWVAGPRDGLGAVLPGIESRPSSPYPVAIATDWIFFIYSPFLLFHILCNVGWEIISRLWRGTRKDVQGSCVPGLTEKIQENSQSGILYIVAEIRSGYLTNLKQMCDHRWHKIPHAPRTLNSKTADSTHSIQIQCDGPDCRCNVRQSGPGTGSDSSLHITWRIEPGSSCMQNNLRR